jgi:hypothetical protein
MTFYNILWLAIFSLGGISLGLLGLVDVNYFTVLLINPSMFNHLIRNIEEAYLSASLPTAPGNVVPVRYQPLKY